MAASVRIEDEAFGDLRFKRLGALLGTNEYDALGRMAWLWKYCTAQHAHTLTDAEISVIIDPELVVEAKLGERISTGKDAGKVRIRGTKGRIEWLAELRKSARKGGLQRSKRAKRDGGKFTSQLPANSPANSPANYQPIAGDAQPAQTSAPAPAPAPALKELNTGGFARAIRTHGTPEQCTGAPPVPPAATTESIPPHERQPNATTPERNLAQLWLFTASNQSGRKPTLEELAAAFADMIEHGDTVEWLTSQIDSRRKSDTWGMFLVALKQARQARDGPTVASGSNGAVRNRRKTPEEMMDEVMGIDRRAAK